MPEDKSTQERKVSVSISVRAPSMTQDQAQALENAIRDVCDDYEGTDVQVMRGAERQTVR